MAERNSGILLHITSLPGNEGIGTMGLNARKFIEFLKKTGQTYWQILPLGPVGYGDSPYQCYSAFAGNISLIDLELLVSEGLIDKKLIDDKPVFDPKVKSFHLVDAWKNNIFKKAFTNFDFGGRSNLEWKYNRFLNEHSWWLNDFSLFMAAKSHFKDKIWNQWPDELKFRMHVGLKNYNDTLKEEIEYWKFMQFLFFRQWFELKEYANSLGIKIIGDAPLYVSTDSADIWSNPDIFSLDKDLKSVLVSGVPPDYFSKTGQLWGNPVYNWETLQQRGYDWWMARLHFNLHLFDLVRIDHFLGLESYWAIPATEKTAVNGKWLPGQGREMLSLLKNQINNLPLIAEDLGLITNEVEALRDDFTLPGMKVLQFAFSSNAKNEHLPHNYGVNSIAYTGTHDNNTTLGWLKSLKGKEKKQFMKYFASNDDNVLLHTIESVWASVAKTAIIPMQDLLQLDSNSRMNIPGTPTGNWTWRFDWKQLEKKHWKFLMELTIKYNRLNSN